MAKTQKQLNTEQGTFNTAMEAHAKIANEEMGFVKRDIALMKNDMLWVKEKLSKVDDRTWYILSGIMITIGVQIVFKFVK